MTRKISAARAGQPMRALRRMAALLLALALALGCAGCGGAGASAASMFLRKTEGTVAVTDAAGGDVAPKENLGLFSGYAVGTEAESFAWIDLDKVKLAKLDENSAINIQKEDKALTIEVVSGGLFFNVTEPLAEDETMEIRSSSMMVGIRGTCGWVEVPDAQHMNVYLLEGTVACAAGEAAATITAGQMAALTAEGDIAVSEFGAASVPAFVRAETVADAQLAAAVLDAAGMDLSQPLPETPRYVETVIDSELEEVLYREWVDFAKDSEPELLIIGPKNDASKRELWFFIFKGEDAAAVSNTQDYISNSCLTLRAEANPSVSVDEQSCSFVEADGRLFLEDYRHIVYQDGNGSEEVANYYGFDAAGEWFGEHIYYMVNAAGNISGSHHTGLFAAETQRDCDPDDFAATRAQYSAVQQLFHSPDGVTLAAAES